MPWHIVGLTPDVPPDVPHALAYRGVDPGCARAMPWHIVGLTPDVPYRGVDPGCAKDGKGGGHRIYLLGLEGAFQPAGTS